jgi:hypothetical protein
VAALALSTTAQAQASSVTVHVSRSAAVAGERVAFRGVVKPARAGVRIVLERRGEILADAQTDGLGRFTAWVRVGQSGVWRARVSGTSVRSAAVRVDVSPRLTIETGPATAFVGAKVVVRAKPATTTRVALTVLRAGRPVAELRVSAGKRTLVPITGTGLFALRAELGASVARARITAAARSLSYGSTGPDVVALRTRLAQLRVHVPYPSARFGSELFDSVVAFQKSRGLARSGVADAATWRALSIDAVPRPRYRGPGEHIEIVKGRQILLVVRDGQTMRFLPVSSGAGGITPIGAFRIKWKALATSTWLGPAILYRTMTFAGNVAIHGFSSVPTYPASHGCVRIPIWAADWLYQRSSVGERVYVYE